MFQLPKRSSAARTRHLFLVAALAFGSVAAAGADPLIHLSNGRLPIAKLLVGDHLAAGLTGGDPDADYVFELRDSDGFLVASAGARTNAAGGVADVLIWPTSGVVGCDLGADPDASVYRYESFADAEEALDGLTLMLTVLEDGVAVAWEPVPIVYVERELVYFSDAAGCLRHTYPNDEDIHVSIRHPNRAMPDRAIFLMARPPGSGQLKVGQSIVDVRFAKPPQRFDFSDLGGDTVTVEVWSLENTVAGVYGGLIRPWSIDDVGTLVLSTDMVFDPINGNSGGIVINSNGCNCLVPPG